ncbi:MAG: AAA family ATPase [bacterium]|nr:AAA family ATPase [bacterium]
MKKILDYSILEKVGETIRSVIYRCRKEEEDSTVIIKVLKIEYPTPSEIARFKQEYMIIKKVDIPGIIKTYNIIDFEKSFALIQEDYIGISLKKAIYIEEKTIRKDISTFLSVAIQLAETLGNLHKMNIIHKDIKPQNILVDINSLGVKITDFGIASVLTHDDDEIYDSNVIVGTLPYMSPEQTGRMNRSVDYRTDLYSLGVTFYEMLTSILPFESEDPMAMIHSHIAIKPVPPKDHNAEIPKMVSAIVMKLLSKNPEERYQNAFGLMADLKECRDRFIRNGRIEFFELGVHDISNRFIVPQKLFGREDEIEELLLAFERAARGSSEIMLVAGRPGIGKSALVREIHKPIVVKRGYFIAGKYNKISMDAPYSAIIDAFRGLVRQVLSENEENIYRWSESLRATLGPNGKIITDIIPEVEFIIGKQSEPAQLDPEESKNRFHLVFEKFTALFAKEEHPVVLFLDDLQWTDQASLDLMTSLVKSSAIKALFIIGAYRNSEVNSGHPLIRAILDMEKEDVAIQTLTLAPLAQSSVEELIADSARCTKEKGAPLAAEVFRKTGGNPFFINQFLYSLYNENLLVLDAMEEGWQWDLERIREIHVTDNIVDLVAGKINKLPVNTREILKVCAGIGKRFDLETLSVICEKSLGETLFDLSEAINEGLIGVSRDEYIFHHDRILEAAYSLIPPEEREQLHYRIGKMELEKMRGENLHARLFSIVDQFNLGSRLISDSKGREKLAALNLEAGKKARASAAYSPALKYFENGIGLLAGTCWKEQYHLALALHVEFVETACCEGDYEKMNQAADVVLAHAGNVLDRIKINKVLIDACKARQDFHGAITGGIDSLKLLGIKIPFKPNKFRIFWELLKVKVSLMGKTPEDLADFPKMTDRRMLAAMKILESMISASYNAAPEVLGLIVLKWVYWASRYGHAPEHAYAYIAYGFILISVLGDIDGGYRFGNLGLSLVKKLGAWRQESLGLFMYNITIRHWKEHLRESSTALYEAYQVGLETGNLEYAANNLAIYDMTFLYLGRDLAELEQEMAKHSRIIAGFKQALASDMHAIVRQAVLNLMGKNFDPTQLTGKVLDEEKAVPGWISANNRTVLSLFYQARLFLYFLFENYSPAFECLEQAKVYLDGRQGAPATRSVVFFDSLVRLALYSEASKQKKRSFLKKIEKNQKLVKKWAENAPMNNLHYYYLVNAERGKALEDYSVAEKSYDLAIALSKKYGYILEEALSNELAAKFYIFRGKERIAGVYLRDAYKCYTRWGAVAKLKQLSELYPGLLSTDRRNVVHLFDDTISSGSRLELLDLASVMKASQAISGEIMLGKLLINMMRIILENAGAERGFIILEEKGKLLVEAEGIVGSEEIEVLESTPLDIHGGLSAAIVNYTARTKERLILNNAVIEGDFTDDFYVVKYKPKSVLCVPILNQGKLIGVVYLENNLSIGAFTAERIEILKLLSSQVAISIENAKLYENLESKVRERTEELQTTLYELGRTNDNLVRVNDNLESANEGLNKAQAVAGRDMKMATNVQSKFLPNAVPQSEEWDIAYMFKPMVGISGDFYDFYESGNELRGVGIFDVSGHGIASGLITMIAKSVFFRHFLSGLSLELNTVFLQANKELIKEIGEVDNYVTGIILRFSGNRIDYVNAGHQDVILKSVKGGTPQVVVKANGESIGGFYLGVKIMERPFELLTFTVESGDYLLLYTDCLEESKNLKGEPFKLESIMKAFEHAPNSSADTVLKYILNEFYKFIGSDKFDDDLTVIVIKKL